jgi:hypothetical protein
VILIENYCSSNFYNTQQYFENHNLTHMKSFVKKIIPLFCGALLIAGCDNPMDEIQPEVDPELNCSSRFIKASKTTGFVQIMWETKGGKEGAQEKKGFAMFSAHEAVLDMDGQVVRPAKGFFIFSVQNENFELERRIGVKVLDVGFGEIGEKKAWIFGEVISDTKCDGGSDHSGCGGGDHDEGGCSGSDDHGGSGSTGGGSDMGGGCSGDHETDDGTTHEEGGCSGSHETTDTIVTTGADSSHDGGCSHDGETTEGDTTHEEGGCSGEDGDTHDEGGCSHDDGSTGGSSDKGGKGKECRVGQFIIIKTHDMGNPGTKDGIAWKWYDSLDNFMIEEEPKKLCKKTILSGNLVVHESKQPNLAWKGR